MTPRKEIFVNTKQALGLIETLELVDLQRGQFDREDQQYPNCYTAALIQVMPIRYETMTEHVIEGQCNFHVDFYCKDGWMDQFEGNTNEADGLIEIDVLDDIINKVQFVQGDFFKPAQLINEEELRISEDGIMSYRLTFSTKIYKRLDYTYTEQSLKPVNQ